MKTERTQSLHFWSQFTPRKLNILRKINICAKSTALGLANNINRKPWKNR